MALATSSHKFAGCLRAVAILAFMGSDQVIAEEVVRTFCGGGRVGLEWADGIHLAIPMDALL